jgi:hypothetical protein
MTVAQVVAALQAPGTAEELRGADSAVAALQAARPPGRPDRRTWRVVVPLAGARRTRRTVLVIGSAVVLTMAFAGTAAAAAAGSLPAPVQRVAAALFGAPAPADDPKVTPTTGPSRPTGLPSDRPATAQATSGSAPGATPAAPSSGASTPAAGPSATSHGAAPSTPPGQTHKPTTPPGQSGKPHPTHS